MIGELKPRLIFADDHVMLVVDIDKYLTAMGHLSVEIVAPDFWASKSRHHGPHTMPMVLTHVPD
jgi:hypothetical protein